VALMLRNMSRRERALVLMSGGVIVVVLAWAWLIAPVVERQRHAAELLPERQKVLERRRDLVARMATMTAEMEAADARVETQAARFLTAAAPAVAASELQKLTKEMAAGAATEIRSERILPPVENGELLMIPLEIAVSGEIRQLVDLLSRLESSPKLLTVQDLRIRVMNVSQPKDLLATITVAGYMLPGSKSKT
jgi:Tfp pilus assembly protein PilO